MPVLARLIETAGIPTVTVTMMPDVASQYRVARIVGVQFPFGHPFGMPGDAATQRAVTAAAVELLAAADQPETRVDLELQWPQDRKTAYKDWQPAEPSPVVKVFLERLTAARREG